MAPWDYQSSPSPFSLSRCSLPSSSRLVRFFRRRDRSRSRNPKLLNYFPIVVATDHVCSPGGTRIGSELEPDITGVFLDHARGTDRKNKARLLLLETILSGEILRRDLVPQTISSVSCLFITNCRDSQKTEKYNS